MLDSENFADIFKKAGFDRVISFVEGDVIGCSIIKNYPEKGISFYPARKRNGEIDSVVLIKIFFYKQDVQGQKVELKVYSSLASDYALSNPQFINPFKDSDDPKSVSSEEKRRSEESKQPDSIENEQGEYFFDLKENQFLIRTNKVEASKVVEKVYSEHIKTVSKGINSYQVKRSIQKNSINFITILGQVLLWLIPNFWNRNFILNDTRAPDEYLIKKVYQKIDYTDMTPKELTKISIAGFHLIVSPTIIITSAILFLSGYFLYIYGGFSVLKYFHKPFIDVTTNPLLIVSFLIFHVWFFDRVLLKFSILLFNQLVYLNKKIQSKKIRI